MLNNVQLIGNLGADPEIKEVGQKATKLAILSIATSKQYKDKEGEKQQDTQWHRVEIWGNVAGVAEAYLQKGDMVFIGGELRTDKWEDEEGETRYMTKVKAHNLQMLRTKGDKNNPGGGDSSEAGGMPPKAQGQGGPGPATPGARDASKGAQGAPQGAPTTEEKQQSQEDPSPLGDDAEEDEGTSGLPF